MVSRRMSTPTTTPSGPRWSMRCRTSVAPGALRRPPRATRSVVPPGDRWRHVHETPGSTSVTSHTSFGRRGCLISKRWPTSMPGPSSGHDPLDRRRPLRPALHVGEHLPDDRRRSVDLDAAVRDHVPNGTQSPTGSSTVLLGGDSIRDHGGNSSTTTRGRPPCRQRNCRVEGRLADGIWNLHRW